MAAIKKPRFGRRPRPKELTRHVRQQLCLLQTEFDRLNQAAGVVGLEPGVFARQAVMERVRAIIGGE